MKLKKILAATLVGAMVLTNVPVGNHGTAVAVAAENQEVTNNVNAVENLQEIDETILAEHAKANSQQTNPTGKGGIAKWAFDGENRWWHSRFQGTPGEGEVQSGLVSATNPIWIQTGFGGEEKLIKKVTYQSRTDSQGGIINKYELQVSTAENPTDGSFEKVAEGNFGDVQTEQAIVLAKAVPAKYIRLVAKSVHPKNQHQSYASAKRIRVFEEVVTPVESITLNKDSLSLKIGESEQLTATVNPDGATFKEVEWYSLNEDIATVDVQTGLVTAKSAGNVTIEVYSTHYSDIKATCEVVVTRDDSALEAAIEEAKAIMAEDGFEVKYTQKSRLALEEALKIAEEAKGDSTQTPETVKLVVENLKAAIAGLEMKAVVTINNNGKEETKYCEVGEQVTVVAAPAPEGKKFSHWAVDNKPIAYGSIYTFTVYGNVNVASVYVEKQVEVVPEATIMCTASYDKSTQIIKFTAKRSVPVGCKVIKHGMILTGNSAWDALYKNNPDSFVLGAERIITKTGKTTGLLGNYSASVKATSPSTWYAKGYVTYEDKNGEQKTVYSDLVQYEVK